MNDIWTRCKMHPTRPLQHPVMQLRTRRVHWSVAVITRGPLRVRGKRSSVCPSIKKGIPKASRQIDGERAGEVECERGTRKSKRKTMLLPVTAEHSENKRTTREFAYVRADHEKRTTRHNETNRRCTWVDFPVDKYPPSDPANLKFPTSPTCLPSECRYTTNENNE